MITVDVDLKPVMRFMAAFPKETRRAVEIAMDRTAYEIRDEIKSMIPQVFDNPVPYTKNSLKVERTRNHNMKASVWFKEPDRMGDHYLLPQVEGGKRKDKGFERALGARFMPSKYAKLNRYGDLPYGTIVQLLSVLGRAEHVAGFSSNLTSNSAKRNRKDRDYVRITSHKSLPPGVYERVQTGVGFGAKTKRHMPFGVYQKGRRRGRFASVVRARGLRPVMLETRANTQYRKLLPFYEKAAIVTGRVFLPLFYREVSQLLRRRF